MTLGANVDSIILKPDKSKAILNHHHWIFSGAVASFPQHLRQGEIVPVRDHRQQLLGHAYINPKSSILARMVAYGDEEPMAALDRAISQAILQRKEVFANSETTAYRLIHAEGDCLPGLIVDCYGDLLVMQIGTLGMDRLRPWIIDQLIEKVAPAAIYEKSVSQTRRDEGLPEELAWRYGEPRLRTAIRENGLKFLIDVEHGQKTGFFLDQREMRQWVRSLSAGKSVLNTFCYTGGFSVYAAAGGAQHVDSVDVSESALDLLIENAALNGQTGQHTTYPQDVFEFLRQESNLYDLVILDPPAFAKRVRDIVPACRGYKDINRLAFKKVQRGGFLLTCSCSYHIEPELFQKVVFQAAMEAGRTAKIIGRHRLAQDHPVNLCHPESDYLKSLLLYVE